MNTEVVAHINLLKKKIQTDPSNAKIHVDLGDIYHKQGMLDEALNEYQKAVDIEPANYNALIKSARIYLKFKQLTNAEKAFHSALHINPRSTTSLIGLFRIYYLAGKTDEAIVLGEKIIKAVPDSLEFHMLLKNLYKRKGDKNKLLSELQKIETLVPDNAEVLKETLSFFMDDNNTERMKEYYQKLMDRNLLNINLRFRIGKYYYDNNYFDTAADHLNDLLKQEDVTPVLDAKSRSYLILIHFGKSNFTKAERLINEIDPVHVEHLDTDIKKKLGAVCYKLGQGEIKKNNPKKAITLMEKATTYDRESTLYKETLKSIKGTVTLTNKRFITKIAMIAGGAVAVCVIIILLISMTRNKIFMYIEPSDGITVMINGNPVRAHVDRSGIISSPTLAVGTYDLEIRKEGYETWKGSVDIVFGRSSRLDLTLVPFYFFLQVLSVPESVEVFIDGESAGSTPFFSDSILACSHSVTIHEKGHMKWDTTITVTERNDSIVLDTVFLKNLAGKWQGSIGQDSYAYNATFDMTITQTDTALTVRFDHKPRDDNYFNGKIKGHIKNNEFYAEGTVTNKYYKVFYWTQEKKNVILQGTISDDWDRIQGKYQIEGTAEQTWWAARSQ
jgi:tetratricopeptide (TPR) repeat protein